MGSSAEPSTEKMSWLTERGFRLPQAAALEGGGKALVA
jgi:hypothetical protein